MDAQTPQCPRCQTAIPGDAPLGVCPSCALAAAIGTFPTWVPRFEGGDQFGPYRIVRLLGRGGMGEVYEARDRARGREVALKVLDARLSRAEDRARFAEEGRLAASLSHPHVVYVFGREEIRGIPVIAMELLRGGTLKDAVSATGPLAPRAAVDAILQVIAGLDAARLAGIVHRDVKPSNCFVDHQGTVKIGDFGISVAGPRRGPQPADPGPAGPGTLAFAAPEQLRGDHVDVRADVYAVGATLSYLLTGQPPSVATDAGGPRLPAGRGHRAIPPELDRLIRQCLAFDPGGRPPSYAALVLALAPFNSTGSEPAEPRRRLAAGLIDVLCVIPAQGLLFSGVHALGRWSHPELTAGASFFVAMIVYATCGEGLWGTTVGLHTLDLSVETPNGGRPGLVRTTWRTLLALLPPVMALVVMTASLGWSVSGVLVAGLSLAGAAALPFVSARRANGFRAWHDALTATRVVRLIRAAHAPPPKTVRVAEAAAVGRVGPYALLSPLGATRHGQLWSAFDPQLERAIWLHVVPARVPAVGPAARDSVSGRLAWLNGARRPGGGWDAYEAPTGRSLPSVDRPEPWPVVRHWLSTLAARLDTALTDGAFEEVDLNRVWIRADREVVLLDFAAPGTRLAPSVPDALTHASAQRFLASVADAGLRDADPMALPLSASSLLRDLRMARFDSLRQVMAALSRPAGESARVTSRLRASTLAISVAAALCAMPLLAAMTDGRWASSLGRGLACVVLALGCGGILRGGLWLRACGIAVVTTDGREASPLRAALRRRHCVERVAARRAGAPQRMGGARRHHRPHQSRRRGLGDRSPRPRTPGPCGWYLPGTSLTIGPCPL